MSFATRSIVPGLMGLLLAGALAPAGAQQIYRIVGPDGKVSFSDKPPMTEGAKAAPVNTGAGSGGGGALPYELRQVTGKYPVTLYSGKDCAPCGAGRAMLTSRGVPFVEKTVTSNEDIQALQRLAGDASLPLLTVGSQQLKGYSDVEWSQYLDAAGYPKTSLLPPSFRNPPPAPLVAVQQAPAAAQNAAPRGPSNATTGTSIGPATINRRTGVSTANTENGAPAAPPVRNTNPAGIQF